MNYGYNYSTVFPPNGYYNDYYCAFNNVNRQNMQITQEKWNTTYSFILCTTKFANPSDISTRYYQS